MTDPQGVVTEYQTAEFRAILLNIGFSAWIAWTATAVPLTGCFPQSGRRSVLGAGRLDPQMPWVKSKVVDALDKPYATDTQAMRELPKRYVKLTPIQRDPSQSSASPKRITVQISSRK